MTGMTPALRLTVLAAFLLLPATLQAASVGTLDGRTLSGPALVLDGKAGTVACGGTTVALADCDWLEPGAGGGLPGAATRAFGVWLVDGSWLPAERIRPGAADHTVELGGPLGTLTLPLAALRGWSTSGEPPAGEKADADQVQLESGVYSGRVEGIVGGKLILRLDIDPKPQELALDQVRGLRLAGAPKAGRGLRLNAVLDDGHPPLRLLPGEPLTLAAAPGVAIGPAITAVRLRIDGGRRVWLGDLAPAHVEETGAFGVVWPWQKDRNLDGSPLRLGGVRYDHGLTVHSQAYLTWKTAAAYERLHATVGIADLVADQGDCAASLIADGKTVWKHDSIKGGEKPLPLDLDLTGVQVLELHVDYGARYDIGDHLVLADAYLVKTR